MSSNDTNIPPETSKNTGAPGAAPAADPNEVIITPDDGPVEHMHRETPVTKPVATPSAEAVAAGLAWQGGNRPSQNNLAALRDRVEHAQAPITPLAPSTPQPPLAPTPLQQPMKQPIANPAIPPENKQPAKRDTVSSNTPFENKLESSQTTSPAKKNSSLRTVRTFKDDMAQVITKKQVSVVSAISAEENRRTRKQLDGVVENGTQKSALSGIGYFILGISVSLLLLGGVGAGVALYFFKKPTSVLPASEIPSYIVVEDQRSVNTDNLSKSQLMSGLVKVQQDLDTKIGSITQLYFIKTVVDPTTQKIVPTLLSASDWLGLLETHIPEALARSLDTKMMFGFYQFDQGRPFIILKTSSYETAFAGMLDWENNLNADLAPLFGPALVQRFTSFIPPEESDDFSNPQATTSATGTASTTAVAATPTPATKRSDPPRTTTLFLPHAFEDAIIVNKDVRLLRDNDGKIALVYGFYDKQTIVITTDENTFKEVVTRLSSRRF